MKIKLISVMYLLISWFRFLDFTVLSPQFDAIFQPFFIELTKQISLKHSDVKKVNNIASCFKGVIRLIGSRQYPDTESDNLRCNTWNHVVIHEIIFSHVLDEIVNDIDAFFRGPFTYIYTYIYMYVLHVCISYRLQAPPRATPGIYLI